MFEQFRLTAFWKTFLKIFCKIFYKEEYISNVKNTWCQIA